MGEKWTAHQIGTAGLHNEVPVYEIRDQHGEVICTVSGSDIAAKIAATPDLLACLEEAVNDSGLDPMRLTWFQRAKSAIRAAQNTAGNGEM